MLGKKTAVFVFVFAHRGCVLIVPFIKLEKIFFED